MNNKKIIFVVDMVKGFCEKGILADHTIKENTLSNIKSLIEKLNPEKENLIYFADTHKEGNPEFDNFPKHCMGGTEEAEIVDELKGYAHTLVEKETTNGFMSLDKDILKPFAEDKDSEYIITGCCSDICVLTFALTLKTYLNTMNGGRVIVPFNCIDTYDLPVVHQREEYNTMAKKLMEVQGIEVPEQYEGEK